MILRAACVQTTSAAEIAPNIVASSEMVRRAHAEGAAFVTMPEVVNLCEKRPGGLESKAFTELKDPALLAYRQLAAELEIWLLAGSLVVKLDDDTRMANRSFLISPRGEIAAKYDKIHMFDVDLAGGESYRESMRFRPGERAVVATTPW